MPRRERLGGQRVGVHLALDLGHAHELAREEHLRRAEGMGWGWRMGGTLRVVRPPWAGRLLEAEGLAHVPTLAEQALV